jgi:NADH dehydrogenase
MKKILILGGTGFVGRALCQRLIDHFGAAGPRLTVPTRRLAHGREILLLPTVDLIDADIHDDAALAPLVAGSDVVVNLVAILHGSAAAFERVHVTLPQRLVAACRAAGVARLVHVSALGADANGPSNYLRSKGRGEALLLASGLDVTVLRPSVIFGAEDRFLNLFAQMQRFLPVVPLAGADARFQPVWVGDVAAALLACIDHPQGGRKPAADAGLTLECAGPDVFTLAELVNLAGRWSGHPRPVVPLPGALARLQAGLMELAPGEPLMSRDNLDSMKVANIASGTLPGLQALGITPTPLAAIGPGYLSPNGIGCERFDALRAGHRRN